VLAVAAASLAGRLWLLGRRPLWFDEIFTVWASRRSLPDLLSVLRRDSGPPLFYVLEKPFVLAGETLVSSDAVARLLPFLATLGLFAGAFTLPRGPARARFVLLVAVFPLIVLYSAEARAYALLALFAFLLFLLALIVPERPGRLVAIGLLTAAALYTHYLALFAVGALAVVAAAEKRPRSALAAVAGSVLFLFWVPVMAAQPPEAVAWMNESPSWFLAGVLSSFGGAGRIPAPFGPALPSGLAAAGVLVSFPLAWALSRAWKDDLAVRRAGAFLVLFFGAVVFASLSRPIAFAGRTEMAVLPVWIWAVALAAEKSRAARVGALAAALCGALATALLLTAPRDPALSTRVLEGLERTGRPGDALFAGGHLYLPARLAADRGRLAMTLHAFPLEQAAHPGWYVPRWPGPGDYGAVAAALDRARAGGRVFFLVPPSFRQAIGRALSGRGVTREVAATPELVLVVWSRAG